VSMGKFQGGTRVSRVKFGVPPNFAGRLGWLVVV
jgi:hypothetical protein